jgi:hypothetical protein
VHLTAFHEQLLAGNPRQWFYGRRAASYTNEGIKSFTFCNKDLSRMTQAGPEVKRHGFDRKSKFIEIIDNDKQRPKARLASRVSGLVNWTNPGYRLWL